MRLSNRHKSGIYNFVNTLMYVILASGVLLFLYERYKHDFLGAESYLLLVIPVLLILLFNFRGKQIFEYDSDGEALNFKNRNLVQLISKPINDEFPKYKLKKYEVVNGLFFRRLYITIISKKEHHIILKYDISYLTNKEVNDLKHSLSKVVKENKEKRESQQTITNE